MQNKLKITAIFLTLLFSLIPFSATTANALNFDSIIPSYGLYCKNQNADIQGKVKYVIDESGNAVRFSEYTVNSDCTSLDIPFISDAFNLPDINFTVNGQAVTSTVYYGEKYSYNAEMRFYQPNIDDVTGTLYTLTAPSENFTVNFSFHENQNYIYSFTNSYQLLRGSNKHDYTLNNAQVNSEYHVFVFNGDFTEFESNAKTVKETLSAKDYIDRFFIPSITASPDLLYSLINMASELNINYAFPDFFYNSFSQPRVNSYHLEVQNLPCTIAYSMTVANTNFIVKQNATGDYKTDYTIQLNSELPYITESNVKLKKQSEYVYSAENVNKDFCFVYGSTHNEQNKTIKIVLFVVLGAAICGLITGSIFIFLKHKKSAEAK